MFDRHRHRSRPQPAPTPPRSGDRQGRRGTPPAPRLPSQAVTTHHIRPY